MDPDDRQRSSNWSCECAANRLTNQEKQTDKQTNGVRCVVASIARRRLLARLENSRSHFFCHNNTPQSDTGET